MYKPATKAKNKTPVPISNETDPRDLPPGTHVWVYLRHSPGDNQTLESQEAEVLRLAKEKKWIVDRVFRDRWASGKSTDREGFDQMIYLARQKPRPAEILIVWEFSRFARNQIHAQLHLAELRVNGWKVLSIKDNIPSGSMAPIFESLIHWKNEQFLIDLRANTLRGLRLIAEQNCLPGGALSKGYTYKEKQIAIHKDGTPRMGRKPIIDPQIAPLVVKAFEMKAQGAPHIAIAKDTGLYPAKSGSWEHLFRNPIYIGEYEFQSEVFKDVYPAIISRELFAEVQKRIPKREHKATRRNHPRRKGSKFFLADIAICAYCGNSMEGKSTQGYRYYVCSQHNQKSDLCPNATLIPAQTVEEEIILVLVANVLTDSYLQSLLEWTNENLNSGLEDLMLQIRKTRSDLEEAERMALRMARNFGTMESPTKTAEKLLREEEAKVLQLSAEMTILEEKRAKSRIEAELEQIQKYVKQAQTLVERGELFDLKEICQQLFARIVMSKDECRVELHFPEI
jgi:DNA invertase Pin-like site-specific DNA recombinase